MKLTAPDAAFLHLCGNLAATPWKIEESAFREAINSIFAAGLSCEAPEMSAVKWAYMALIKAGGYEPGGTPTIRSDAFLEAFRGFSADVAWANERRAAAIMTKYFMERRAS